jgi:DNA-binding MarR family transcriptional regulator
MTRGRLDISAQPRLGTLLKRAEQAMLRAKNGALKPVGLTLAQYVALTELERGPGVTAATLSRACQVSPQAMMIVLKAMEEQGLISRSSHPRHTNVLEIHVTEVGKDALHAGRKRLLPIERRVFQAFSSKEVDLFINLLSRLSQAFETEQS